MSSAYRTVLTNPKAFFEGASDPPDPLGPVVIVLVYAVVGFIGATQFRLFLQGLLSLEQYSQFSGSFTPAAVIAPFVMWVLYALLFYALSGIFHRRWIRSIQIIGVSDSGAAATTTDVVLSPENETVDPDETVSYDVVVETANGGVGSFNLSVSSNSTDVAGIQGVTYAD